MQQPDLLVLGGGGPAGYSAAIRASQLGKKVIVAERCGVGGGACLNRGCIPTKSLLESARFYRELDFAAKHGVSLQIGELDYGAVLAQKKCHGNPPGGGTRILLKRREIEIVPGEARFLSSTEIRVGDRTFQPDKVIIATGTVPMQLPGLETDGEFVLNSDQLLDLAALPESLLIVGGGVIGCEFATIFASFGVEVTIVEMQEQILPPRRIRKSAAL